MDEVGVLTESFGLKQQGKLARMAAWKPPNNTTSARARNFASNSTTLDQNSSSYSSRSSQNSNSVNGYFFYDHETLYSSQKSLKFGGLDDGFDIFGVFQNNSRQTTKNGPGSSFDYDSIFSNSNYSSAKLSSDGDILGGFNSSNSIYNDDIFGSFASKRSKLHRLMTCLGPLAEKRRKPERICRANTGMNELAFTSADDPFVILESTSTTTKLTFTDPLEEFSKFNLSGSTNRLGSSNISAQRPPPKPGQVLKSNKDPLSFGEFEEVEGESEERQRARLGQHQRTQDRVVSKAVADMNQRDLQIQQEQAEGRRIADKVDAEMKRWAAGKEGNMRALLSSLQHVLWPECGWEPVSLTDLITSASVKKVYRKATLCVHPDKSLPSLRIYLAIMDPFPEFFKDFAYTVNTFVVGVCIEQIAKKIVV
ncbi:hypothetical protein GH714_001243 [Hevea brasiliensis]|uniref:J domain-containing protein n=1 Tax=Hevea brasiliensis TaxID=3981 RepID=A0A6A6LAP7_HEVBR|nr:hypothetical protein GH714_001243 [Hevea brasiliensis]